MTLKAEPLAGWLSCICVMLSDQAHTVPCAYPEMLVQLSAEQGSETLQKTFFNYLDSNTFLKKVYFSDGKSCHRRRRHWLTLSLLEWDYDCNDYTYETGHSRLDAGCNHITHIMCLHMYMDIRPFTRLTIVESSMARCT